MKLHPISGKSYKAVGGSLKNISASFHLKAGPLCPRLREGAHPEVISRGKTCKKAGLQPWELRENIYIKKKNTDSHFTDHQWALQLLLYLYQRHEIKLLLLL